MTQIGEGVAVIPPGGKEKCVFCGKEHQKEKKANKANFSRDMAKLKKEGRSYSKENYSSYYPGSDMAPLVKWKKNINITGGYKAAAHHCIALKTVSEHEISGELKEAGYDPNRGSNCSWLPYSAAQFTRARAYGKALQKHRGGHTDSYFEKVLEHLDKIAKLITNDFCANSRTASKQDLLYYIELQEKAIWRGLAKSKMNQYHLYNTSYLDPTRDWGEFDLEKNKSKSDIIGTNFFADDAAAEADSSDDPE